MVTTLVTELQQTSQASQRTSSLQEVVREEFSRSGSALHIHAEANGQKGLEVLAQFIGFLQSRSTVGCDEIESFEWFFIQIWRFGLDHFDGHDAQRPDVNLWSILFLLHNFRCHPVRGSNHGGTLALLLCELGTEPEVG